QDCEIVVCDHSMHMQNTTRVGSVRNLREGRILRSVAVCIDLQGVGSVPTDRHPSNRRVITASAGPLVELADIGSVHGCFDDDKVSTSPPGPLCAFLRKLI